jgi:hypothetical protein
VERYVLEELTAELDRDAPGLLAVRLSGRSASRDAGEILAPLFDRLLAVGREEGRVLALHFERLEHFNSSTIAALVRFIRTAHAAKIGLTVVYDTRQHWQAVSFDALRRALRPFGGTAGTAVHFAEASAPPR